jgi:hypothetical protein
MPWSNAKPQKHIRTFVIHLILLLPRFYTANSEDSLDSAISLSRRSNSVPEWPTDDNVIHQIYCSGPRPWNIPGVSSWPEGVNPGWYHDLTSLCTYNSWNAINMACYCPAPYISDQVYCHPPPLSFPGLYNSGLRSHCEYSCKCVVSPVIFNDPDNVIEDHLTGWGINWNNHGPTRRKPRSRHSRGGFKPLYSPETRGGGGLYASPSDESSEETNPISPDITQILSNDEIGTDSPNRDSRPSSASSPSCHSSCNGMTECGGMTFGCVCIVDVSLDQTFAGETRFASSTCGYMRKRKRSSSQLPGLELEQLCACNNTYVSAGCCASADGIIEEDLSLKRGTLNFEGL